jgi:hypothetical protein
MERLLHEISEQPRIVQGLLDRAKAPSAVVLAARSSSGHAAIYGRYLLWRWTSPEGDQHAMRVCP